MNDEQQIRSLLAVAAEPSDQVQPPVERLLGRSRRARKTRAACSVLGVAALASATFALPPVVRSLSHGQSGPGPTASQSPGPTAAELSRFRWSALPASPLGPRSQPLLAWTGKYLLELGGAKNGTTQDSGAAFDPGTRRWHRIAQVRANVGFSNAVAVWTGRQLFVVNGQLDMCLMVPGHPSETSRCLPNAGLYDPAADRWTTTRLPGKMWGLTLMAAAWTGRDIVIAGVNARRGRPGVAAYDPATRHWQMITPQLPARHSPVAFAMVAASNRVILWSLWSRSKKISKNGYSVSSGIDVLSLDRSGRWSTVTGNWPQHTVVENPAYGSGKILIPSGQIWCGLCSHPYGDSPAKLADADTLGLTSVPAGPLASRDFIEPSIWLWNGSSALAANVGTPWSEPAGVHMAWISQMAAFDPASRRWHALPVPPGRALIAANPLWAGRQLLLLTEGGGLLSFHR